MKIIIFYHNGFVRMKWYIDMKWTSWQSIQWNLVGSLLHPLEASSDVVGTESKLPYHCVSPHHPAKISQKKRKYYKWETHFRYHDVKGKAYFLSKTWNKFELLIVYAALQSILIKCHEWLWIKETNQSTEVELLGDSPGISVSKTAFWASLVAQW